MKAWITTDFFGGSFFFVSSACVLPLAFHAMSVIPKAHSATVAQTEFLRIMRTLPTACRLPD